MVINYNLYICRAYSMVFLVSLILYGYDVRMKIAAGANRSVLRSCRAVCSEGDKSLIWARVNQCVMSSL